MGIKIDTTETDEQFAERVFGQLRTAEENQSRDVALLLARELIRLDIEAGTTPEGEVTLDTGEMVYRRYAHDFWIEHNTMMCDQISMITRAQFSRAYYVVRLLAAKPVTADE